MAGGISSRTRTTICIASVLLVAVLASTSCLTVASQARAQASGEPIDLRIGFLGRLDNLNPLMGFTEASRIYCGLVYDCLQAVGNDLESIPNLATDWRIVPETDPELVLSGEPYGSVWEYNLTPNAQWHDGTPFTAADVAFTINLNCEGSNFTTSWTFQPYAYFMQYAEAVDIDTVRVHFYDRASGEPKPAAYGDSLFVWILPEHLLRAMSHSTVVFSWNGTFDSTVPPVVGTGPFMVTDAVWDELATGEQLTLVRNPNYHWAADRGIEVSFDKVVMRFYENGSALEDALRVGELDVAPLPRDNYLALRDDIGAGTVSGLETFEGLGPDQYWTYLGLNMKNTGPNPSRLDPAVRQAMAMATDKGYIVSEYYGGLAEEGSTLLSPVSPWHYEPTSTELWNRNLTAAADLLESAGYKYPYVGAPTRAATADSLAVQMGWVVEWKSLEFEMFVRQEYPEELQIAQHLQSIWFQIGVWLNILVVSEEVLGSYVYSLEYDTVLWCWLSDPDPSYIFFCQSEAAWGSWSDNLYYNPAYEENYSLSVSELDPARRLTHVENCQRIHYLDAAYIILAYPYQTYAWRTDTVIGWGDWSADPGRSVDACWGGNPLYFDLKPIPPNAPPVAAFTVSPVAVEPYEPFTVNASSSSDAEDPGSALVVRWDWEDDGTWDTDDSPVKTAEHSYSSPGTYTIRLEVKDTGGLTNTTTMEIEVVDLQPPVAAFTVSPVAVEPYEPFTVNASSSSDAEDPGSALVVRWDWEDDGTWDTDWSATKTAQHSYAALGTYTIRLEVMDTDGLTNTTTMEIEVVDLQPPVAEVSLDGIQGTNEWYVTVVHASLLATDDASGVSAIYWRVNGGEWDEYDEVVNLSAGGVHILDFYAVDNAGHESELDTVVVKIDWIPPTVLMLQVQGIEFSSSDVSIWWDSFDTMSGLNKTEVRVDGSALTPLEDFDYYVSDLDPLATCLNLTGLEDGEHYVEVLVWDNAGFVTSARLDFSVDTSVRVQFLGLDWWIWLIILCVIVGLSVSFLFGIRRSAKGRSEKADVGSVRSGIAYPEDKGTGAPSEKPQEAEPPPPEEDQLGGD